MTANACVNGCGHGENTSCQELVLSRVQSWYELNPQGLLGDGWGETVFVEGGTVGPGLFGDSMDVEPIGSRHWRNHTDPLLEVIQKIGAKIIRLKSAYFGPFGCILVRDGSSPCELLIALNPLILLGFSAIYEGAPGWDRTNDQRIRNPLLYPLSYGCICVRG